MRHWTLAEAITYGRGTERPFLCPVHGDSRPSASVNMVKKKWFCYTCGARGGLTGEHALLEPDYEEMREWFEAKMEEGRVYPESWLSRWDTGAVHPYWSARVGDRAARHFRLGYDPERDAVTYPLRDPAGRVLGVVRRRQDDGRGPKYLYPTGVDMGSLLFGFTPAQRDVLVLVEGGLDSVACWNSGYDAFAIYGSRLGEGQRRLIARVDPRTIYTAFDQDDAGWSAHVQVKRAFRHCVVERLTWPLSWGKDIDEIGPERRASVLAQTRQHSIDSTSCRSASSESTKTLRIRTSGSTSRRSRLSIRRSDT